ncbi:MAG: DUF6364 family protein [Bacteroidota bacterium]
MDVKLTLKLNQQTIEKAKRYSKDKGLSLSKLIENYLEALTGDTVEDFKISPLVKSLTGVVKIDDVDSKEAYIDYLDQKYA